MTKITDRQYEEILYEVVHNLELEDLKRVVFDFVKLLAHDHKLTHGRHIIEDFIHVVKKKENITEMVLYSARKLDEKTKNAIKKIFNDKIEITEKIDPSLIGGFVAETNDFRLNASVKHKLNLLQNHLLK